MDTKPIVTVDTLYNLLIHPKHPDLVQHVIGRALVGIFNNQTKDEQSANSTNNHNGMGFSHCDAKSGSLTAKYYITHKRLEPWMIEKWTKISERTGYPRLCKYHRQLNEIAILKQQLKGEKND